MTIMSTRWWVPEGSAQVRFGDIAPALLSAWRGGWGGPDHALARRVVDHLNATGFTPEEGTGMSSHASNKTVHADIPAPTPSPPEPQERFYTEYGSGHSWVVDRSGETDSIRAGHHETAELVASLLNLEAKHEDQGGVGKAIEQADVRSRMRSAAMSRMEAELDEARAEVERLTAELASATARGDTFQAKFQEQCQRGDNLFTGRYKTIQRAVTAEAELAEARAELAKREAWENELAVELPEDWDGDSAQSHIIAEYVREMGRRLSAAGISRHRFVDEAPAVPQGDGPTEPPHEFQGHPGGVCTSCDCQMETGNHLRPTEPLFTGHIGGHGWQSGRDEYVTVEAPARPDARVHRLLGMEVAVFPLGHGPTNRPVTAEMVYEAIEAAGVRDGLDRGDGPAYIRPCDWTLGETAAVAAALNEESDGRTT